MPPERPFGSAKVYCARWVSSSSSSFFFFVFSSDGCWLSACEGSGLVVVEEESLGRQVQEGKRLA